MFLIPSQETMYSHIYRAREREDLSLETSMQDQVCQLCHWTSVKVHVVVYNLLMIYCINSNMQNRAILSKTIVSRPCYYICYHEGLSFNPWTWSWTHQISTPTFFKINSDVCSVLARVLIVCVNITCRGMVRMKL
jgi:hypothetical protein